MIQPVQRGAALLRDIDEARPETGTVMLWWLGQSGYIFKTASANWTIDLYLSEVLTHKYAQTDKPHIRMTEAPLRGNEITQARWVFASHRHSDHLDPETMPLLMVFSPEARLVLPAAVVNYAVQKLGLPAERLMPTRGDETITVGALTVHVLPSAHPTFEYTEAGGYPFLGFVFEVDGLRIYHSGDTVIYDGLADRLKALRPDVMILPINGKVRDDVPPNMNMSEAVALAKAVGPKLVIPHHYDMFTFNTANVSDFARLAEAEGVPSAVLQPGARFAWSPGAG